MIPDKVHRQSLFGRRLTPAGDPFLLCCALCCGLALLAVAGSRGGSAAAAPPQAAAASAAIGAAAAPGRPGGLSGPQAAAAADAVVRLKELVTAAQRERQALQAEEQQWLQRKAADQAAPRAPRPAAPVDHAKQEVLQERARLTREERDLAKAEKTIASDAKELHNVQALLQKEEATARRAGGSRKAATELREISGNADRQVQRLNGDLRKADHMLAGLRGDEAQVEQVRGTWTAVKAQYGVSKNIDFKHSVEEKRHKKLQKKAAEASQRLARLRGESSELARRQSFLDQQARQVKP